MPPCCKGRRLHIELDPAAPVKPPARYRVVGQAAPRVDIPAKATGGTRLRAGHARARHAARPGGAAALCRDRPWQGGSGAAWSRWTRPPLAGIPGHRRTSWCVGDFVGVVAEREEHAALAAERLALTWAPGPTLPDLTDVAGVLARQPEHAPPTAGPRRRGCRDRRRRPAPAPQLRLAVPDARFHRPVLFRRGLDGRRA